MDTFLRWRQIAVRSVHTRKNHHRFFSPLYTCIYIYIYLPVRIYNSFKVFCIITHCVPWLTLLLWLLHYLVIWSSPFILSTVHTAAIKELTFSSYDSPRLCYSHSMCSYPLLNCVLNLKSIIYAYTQKNDLKSDLIHFNAPVENNNARALVYLRVHL